MEGMVGSCLVIPCRFSYSDYPPNDKGRVVWYQYVNKGYPLVCDPKNPNEVIEKFRGKTSLYGSPDKGDCSLKIDSLDWPHHEEMVYPWVDPDYVTYRYFRFYDKAVKIHVRDNADEPKLYFSGSRTVGEQMTVQCSAYHTCRPRPPTLRLTVAGHTGTPKVNHKEVHEGKWEITMEMTWILDNAHQTITCEVRHPSGRSASKTVSLQGQCSVTKVTINPSSEEFLEGVEKDVVCSVSYACQEQRPDLSWNYGGMKVSSEFQKRGSGSWESRSTLTFKAGASDHNQALKCTARFTNGQIQEGYITLKVKRAMFSLGWRFSMPSQVTGLQGSCLVIPCHFEYSSTLPSDISVMWYKYTPGEYPVVYSPARPGDVISDFRGKTSLYGSPSDRSCSLKINPVEMNHHRQRLYTWVDPKPISSYHRQNYQDKTVEIYVTDRVDKPEMQIIGIPKVGEQISVQCSAYHMCPATPPKLSLIGLPETSRPRETQAQDVKWKITLVQTWVLVEDQQTVSCRVQHPEGQEAQADITIQAECSVGEIITDPGPVEFLEGKQSLLPILLPATAAALLALALCVGVLTCRKRCSRKSTDQHSLRPPQPDNQRSFWKRFSRRHEGNSTSWNVGNTGHRELPRDCPRRPPRPEERASFWRRFSRRNPKDFLDRPPRPEKRRSIWSRFSRQQHGNGPEMNVGYRANNESLAGNVQTKPKPRCPSPVRNPKSAHAAKHRNDTPYFEEEEEVDYENSFKEDVYANM
ncbi:uncharacterized protein LOC135241083 isoform X2 [Anguilla rostrata]|uniref:uncharacterized protein LOC135241083 isoform X2 n=1 Tax=Anguilla rostrata TaxID=7938 RepID=UPI0030CE0AEA